ncbi:MAG: 2-hydroxyacyl-CoA dehydratase [Deltaproteobacteria bacterium]|nr:2-hydroxyacyl-CoA dehydratase [Deltaproteobacteria bacterium]
MDTLSKLIGVANSLENHYIDEWKQQGGKVVGFFSSYIPEEIIYAAGLLPYRVRPVGCTQTREANAYMSNVNCTFAKCCLEYALGDEFTFLDGLVSMNSCDHVRRLYDIWKIKNPLPFMHFLSVPHLTHERALDWYKDEIATFKDAIEGHFRVSVTRDKLANAIAVYNRTRSLLRQLSDMLKKDLPPLTGLEYLSIVLAGFCIPKEQYNLLLEELMKEIEGRKPDLRYKARLLLMGSAFDDLNFAQVIEESGGLIATDTLSFGSRFHHGVLKGDGDPIGELAEFYLRRPGCPRMADTAKDRLDLLERKIADFRIDGVIYQRIRYCNLWGGEAFLTAKKLEAREVPFINLEREYYPTAPGALRTRIEAFIERIST